MEAEENEGGRGTGVGVASPRRGEDLRIAGARAVEILVVEGEEVPKGITKSSTTGSFLYLPFLGLLVYGAAEVRTRSGNGYENLAVNCSVFIEVNRIIRNVPFHL